MRAEPATIDLLVHGAHELASPRGTSPRGGAELGLLERSPAGALAVDAGRILALGSEQELRTRYRARRELDCAGGIVVPGFVDAHTHPVFAGTREAEFEARLAGQSYLDIARAGGGILSSVRGLRAASTEELVRLLLVRLDRFLEAGTTTIEAKSGYGLSLPDELRSLEALRLAAEQHPVEIVPTFLGAHDYPLEFRERREAYVDLVVDEMLPRVAEGRLAEYCDVFAEAHVFDLAASRRVLERARALGLGLRLHADQLTPLGGAELAAELGAASADHLEHVTEQGIAALARAGTVPVLCPVVPLFLRQRDEAPARSLVEAGLAPAFASDFNPGSCYLQSLPETLSWAALRYGVTAAEALCGATLNAACSLGRGGRLGSLETGKDADLVVLDLPDLRHLVYELGRNPVRAVVKRGLVVLEREPFRARREA